MPLKSKKPEDWLTNFRLLIFLEIEDLLSFRYEKQANLPGKNRILQLSVNYCSWK
jgi:hypothetical protein